MGVALFLIGLAGIIAGIVLFIIALVKKTGWGVVRSLVIGLVAFVLLVIGVIIGVSQDSTSESITENNHSTTNVNLAEDSGKSRFNPVPYNSSLTYNDQRVTILTSSLVNSIGWSKASDNERYLVVKIRVDFLGNNSEKKNYLSSVSFRTVGDVGHIYDNELLIDNDNSLKTGEYFGGSSTSGELVFKIDKQDKNMVLIWNCSFGIDRYFQIPSVQ